MSLRGDFVVSQPLEDPESGSLLCWNGEVWIVQGKTIDGNDAEVIFNLLTIAVQEASYERALSKIVSIISDISGPFAFVFYDALHHCVFFGRDALGRRSLAIRNTLPESLVVSSICDTVDFEVWSEVEADGMYIFHLEGAFESSAPMSGAIEHIPRTHKKPDIAQEFALQSPFPDFNRAIGGDTSAPLNLKSPAVHSLFQKLRNSLLLRLHNIPLPPSDAPNPARLAILFSGGLDCTVLARLAHEILPKAQSIDLLNVAFENPRVIQAAASGLRPIPSSAYTVCPDRITGLSSYAEVLKVCPERTWRFMAIDVPYAELQSHRAQIVSLIYPHNTEMDFSIACALYFATRGSGTITHPDTAPASYSTPARVLLSGLGADELFGGYTRHATAFSRRGCSGLIDELEIDFLRLGKRNLGRDDRVMSHWGKEVRYPYLDENLVSWALSVPVWEKYGFEVSNDNACEGDDDSPRLDPSKKVLRLLAWKLGMRGAAAEKKRAIQFGARTAKMEGGGKKGTASLT